MQQPIQPTQPTAGRPMGVTILAVLAAIGGVLGLLGSLALIGLGGLAAAGGAAAVGGIATIYGILVLVLSVLSLVFAYGAWTLKPWAWTLGVGLEVVAILLAVWNLVAFQDYTSAIISFLIAAVILYYLFRPEVQAAFGRS